MTTAPDTMARAVEETAATAKTVPPLFTPGSPISDETARTVAILTAHMALLEETEGDEPVAAWSDHFHKLQDDVLKSAVATADELVTKVGAHIISTALFLTRDWSPITVDQALDRLDAEGEYSDTGYALRTLMQGLTRAVASPGANSAWAEAKAAYDVAWAGFDASLTALGQVEKQVHAGVLQRDDPAIAAAEAAERETSEAESWAFARLMETPAPSLTEAVCKLNVYRRTQPLGIDGPVYDGAKTNVAAAFRLTADDITRCAAKQIPTTPMGDRAAWDAALANYQDAKARYSEAGGIGRNGDEWFAIFADMPAEILHESLHYPVHMRWGCEDALMRDVLVSPADKARLRPLVGHWTGIFSERLRTQSDRGCDRLSELHDDAEVALMKTPAPDLQALAFKSALAASEAEDDKFGYDDLGLVSFREHDGYDRAVAVEIHRDILRAAGLDHPVLHLPPFNPRRWIKHFEGEGGEVSSPDGDALLVLLPTYAEPEARRVASAMLAEIKAESWKARAVYFAAEARREGGNDPLVDNRLNSGKTDRRGGRQPHHVHRIGAGSVFRFVKRDGLPVARHEDVDLDWGLS